MGARECARSLGRAFLFFPPRQAERHPGKDEEYFFSHWEKLAALFVGKLEVSAAFAGCCLDVHTPTSRQMGSSNLWSSKMVKIEVSF